MPHPISPLGAAHTLIGLVPVAAGLYSLVRFRRIDPSTGPGKLYLVGLTLSVLTSFGLSSTGGVNPGHVLGVLALLAAFGGAALIPRLAVFGRLRPALQTFGLSFSFFLLLVPGIAETLTRLPVGSPLAAGPEDPAVRATLAAWLFLFLAGFALQVADLRAAGRRRADAGKP